MGLVLFALGATRDYGEAVSRQLGIGLSPHEERHFEDGEHKARSLVDVRDEDVFVLQSLYADAEACIDDKLVNLLFLIGALRDASAASVTAVIPYLAYARQDRRTEPGDPVTTRYVARLLEAVGTDRVIVLDVHNVAAFENAFGCRTEHLEATELFAAHFARNAGKGELAVVSPDAGGIGRAQRFRAALSRHLGRPIGLALMEKYRADGALEGETFGGDVQGRTAIIFDDMISTGATIVRAARACRARGAAGIFAAATHGLFVGQANALLSQAGLSGIVVTDTVAASAPNAVILETAPLVAQAIKKGDSYVHQP